MTGVWSINVGNHILTYAAQHPSRRKTSSRPRRKLDSSHYCALFISCVQFWNMSVDPSRTRSRWNRDGCHVGCAPYNWETSIRYPAVAYCAVLRILPFFSFPVVHRWSLLGGGCRGRSVKLNSRLISRWIVSTWVLCCSSLRYPLTRTYGD
jgi:hypothetical protein